MNDFSFQAEKDVTAYVLEVGQNARRAARSLAVASTAQKNAALLGAAIALEANTDAILEANAQDLARARTAGFDAAFLDRLTLTTKSIHAMAQGLREVATLSDPVGEMSELAFRPSGIQVGRMRVPLGVIGMIYESRPSVTADAAALCLKSGNACILRGGSEAFESNRAIHGCLTSAIRAAGLPEHAVQWIRTTDRTAVGEMLKLRGVIDVIIPRGGKSLTSRIAEESRVPVIKHLDGICHVYVDSAADLTMAVRIADNAKTQRYSPCNAMETLLVAAEVASTFLPKIGRIYADKGVEMRACAKSIALLQAAGLPNTRLATEGDFHTEYLAPIVSIRVVADIDDAIAHIATYGSQHTESIVTENHAHAMRFLREVDSSSVMVNASTRFADGFEFGLGAEIGISTDKLHARGPVGLVGLTSQKWIVFGTGQIRE